MSKWGLAYKGVEILTPEEWNKVVDALEELDKRAPIGINGGKVAFDGDGSTISFKISHGLGSVPTVAIVGKSASGLPDIDYWDADTAYITVYFKSPPPVGTGNVVLWWFALKL